MRILVIGSGGREHALCWKIAASPKCEKLYCAPGNGGISDMAELVDIKADNIDALLKFAKEKKIDLTVVGPEVPLVAGIVDKFEAAGLRIFGPRKDCALLEGSKIFSKELMTKALVPTADFEVFDSSDAALKYLEGKKPPLVVKADGTSPTYNTVESAWRRAVARVTDPELPPEKQIKQKDLRIHDLRHVWTVRAIEHGMTAFECARLLGHADLSMVSKRYGDVTPGRVAGIVASMSVSGPLAVAAAAPARRRKAPSPEPIPFDAARAREAAGNE